jgi:hypothetical protein
MPDPRLTATLSLSAAGVLALMLLVGLLTGASQQHFEAVLPVATYAEDLLAQATPLRVILTLDACFIALYVTSSVLLSQALTREHNRVLTRLAMVLTCAAGVLDLIENHHIAAMLSMAEQGLLLSAAEIAAQTVASTLKWHLGYLAFFLLGVALVPRTRAEWLLRWALIALQLPLGAALYAVPPSLAPLLLWLRYLNVLSGFVLFAWFLLHARSPDRASVLSGSASPA